MCRLYATLYNFAGIDTAADYSRRFQSFKPRRTQKYAAAHNLRHIIRNPYKNIIEKTVNKLFLLT